MTYTAFGPVPDRITDPARLAAEVATLVADLTTLAGHGLAEIVNASLEAELSRAADVVFDQLRVLSYLAGAPELPCCAGDDEEAVAGWAETVATIARTGQLPG